MVPSPLVSSLLLLSLLCSSSSSICLLHLQIGAHAHSASPTRSEASHPDAACSAWLVQSTPTDLPQLPTIPGLLSTGDVFQWIAGNATQSLDLLVQYWELLAQPNNSQSGDYGYSAGDMERFGASVGQAVYRSLDAAAARAINMRIIQHSGVFPDYDKESADLAASNPNVKNVTLRLDQWWGSGIVHAKVWIADQKDLYIGSANNDWKSLTQVKELGIYMRNCPNVAKIVEGYFENLQKLSSLNASQYTKQTWDEQFQLSRQVPCWSQFLSPEDRCKSPLPNTALGTNDIGYPPRFDPYVMPVDLVTPGNSKNVSQPTTSNVYLSFSPPEVSFQDHQTDEQGWVGTILSASINGTVRISTMDWLGQSQYSSGTVYWSALSTAISQVVFTKNVKVKVLVAYWTHSLDGTVQYLNALNYTNTLCYSSRYNKCKGNVEIKFFKVPGFDRTGPKLVSGSQVSNNTYPSYTRVLHAKYCVSDVRVHIGTSNLVWDYFYTTSGVSFGAYDAMLVSQLQAVFDADWASPYAFPYQSVESSPA